MDTFTTKQAIDRAWHMLTRLHGVRLLLASEAARRDQKLVRLSGVSVIPDEDGPKLGALAQLLFDRASGSEGNEAFEMIAAAAAAVSKPVDRRR